MSVTEDDFLIYHGDDSLYHSRGQTQGLPLQRIVFPQFKPVSSLLLLNTNYISSFSTSFPSLSLYIFLLIPDSYFFNRLTINRLTPFILLITNYSLLNFILDTVFVHLAIFSPPEYSMLTKRLIKCV